MRKGVVNGVMEIFMMVFTILVFIWLDSSRNEVEEKIEIEDFIHNDMVKEI